MSFISGFIVLKKSYQDNVAVSWWRWIVDIGEYIIIIIIIIIVFLIYFFFIT